MITINVDNVNEALYAGTMWFKQGLAREIAPRGQRTLEITEPVATTYRRPLNRVLFSPERDANPFFHFFEALWMLAGRNDVDFLAGFNKRMGEFSDDGVTLNGAYGYRWRRHFGYDQLNEVTRLLKSDPDSRRAVLAMWDPFVDLAGGSKDTPCNTQIYFKIREGKLNMTVCNRSNDMIWGAYGANVVHMSFLQEYMALRLGCEVGFYTQISDSFHVYLDGPGGKVWDRVSACNDLLGSDQYLLGRVKPLPLRDVATADTFDHDLAVFFSFVKTGAFDAAITTRTRYKSRFFQHVVVPMLETWMYRHDEDEPIPGEDHVRDADAIQAPDWRWAVREWLDRRAK